MSESGVKHPLRKSVINKQKVTG